MRNPAAIPAINKRGIVDVYLSVTDGVTLKAGPNVEELL